MLAVRVVAGRMGQLALLYLAIFSTLVLSFSSLLGAEHRGVPISTLVIEDAGGRFFFWNTLLFISTLLVSLVMLMTSQGARKGAIVKVIASWLIIAIILYQNNVSSRPDAFSYALQLERQCQNRGRNPIDIAIFTGPNWSFHLSRRQIDRLCEGSMIVSHLNGNHQMSWECNICLDP